jgi:ketosteroid isomerase-like protein
MKRTRAPGTRTASTASGVPIEMELAHVLAVRDRKIAYIAEFFDRSEAMEHIGISD